MKRVGRKKAQSSGKSWKKRQASKKEQKEKKERKKRGLDIGAPRKVNEEQHTNERGKSKRVRATHKGEVGESKRVGAALKATDAVVVDGVVHILLRFAAALVVLSGVICTRRRVRSAQIPIDPTRPVSSQQGEEKRGESTSASTQSRACAHCAWVGGARARTRAT